MDKTNPITVKIRAEQGCFCRRHSLETNRLIDDYLRSHRDSCEEFEYYEHETGPESF